MFYSIIIEYFVTYFVHILKFLGSTGYSFPSPPTVNAAMDGIFVISGVGMFCVSQYENKLLIPILNRITYQNFHHFSLSQAVASIRVFIEMNQNQSKTFAHVLTIQQLANGSRFVQLRTRAKQNIKCAYRHSWFVNEVNVCSRLVHCHFSVRRGT